MTGAAKTGIFLGLPNARQFEPVVQLGDNAPSTGLTFKVVMDAVLASDCASVAFPATLSSGDSSNDTSLWWLPDGGSLTMLAREGSGADGGGFHKTFTSLAIPGGHTGPIFLASLVQGFDGVDKTNDIGVWGADSARSVRKLFRDAIRSRRVKW